jgi:hypothetical protein
VRNGYKILERKPCCCPRRRWEGNIRMDFREMLWEDEDWSHLTQEIVVGYCEHGNELSGSKNTGNFLTR